MTGEQMKVLDVLKFAIQMEIDGKRYYEQAGKMALNKLGIELYGWLAGQEEKHRSAFEQIYETMRKKAGWPAVSFVQEKRRGLKTLFAKAMTSAAKGAKGSPEEFEAIDKAKEMELKSRDFYQKQGAAASDRAEKTFYTSLANEERGHYLTLVDYQEYLIDPAGYFVKSERPSLDGG